MKTWGKLTGTVMSAVLASVLAISQLSCLTPGDQASLDGFNASMQNTVLVVGKDKQTVLELKAELEKYREEFVKVVEDIKAKKVPAESGIALLGKIMANIDATQAKVVSVQKLIDENVASAKNISLSIEDLRKKDIPWQYWLLPIGTALAGIASMFVPGISPLAQMLSTANQQLGATKEAAGSMSRTLDAVATSPEAVTLKENLMNREQASDELATKAIYDEIRAQAKANLL